MLDINIPYIVLILIVVFIHEYGHYYFAKKYGVGVTDFSIGFGKEIFGWNDKSGTRWKICWIPLGGYVKFFGDRNVFSQADKEKIISNYNKEEQISVASYSPFQPIQLYYKFEGFWEDPDNPGTYLPIEANGAKALTSGRPDNITLP